MVVLRRLLVGLALLIAGVFAAAPQYSVGPISAVDAVVDSIAPQAQALTPSQRIILKRGISPVASWSAATDPFPSTILSHSRASNATMFDSTGKLTYAPNNWLRYSNTFTNAAWLNVTMTITNANAVADPFGGTNATTLTAAGATSVIQQVTARDAATGLNTLWMRRRTGTGQISLIKPDGSNNYVTLTGTWQQVTSTSAQGGNYFYFGVQIDTAGDAIDVYYGTSSKVTYETTPRTADQVITTSAAYYGPRIDYDPNTLAVKGLLIEESRTNYATYSNNMAGGTLTASGGAIAGGVADLSGGTTGITFTATAGNATHHAIKTGGNSLTAGTKYTATFWLKQGNAAYTVFGEIGDTPYVWGSIKWSDLSVQTNGQDGAIVSTPIAFGGGIYQVSITYTRTITGASILGFGPNTVSAATIGNAANIFNAAGTETAICVAWQIEAGAFSTSFIPTAASSVTRAADVVQFTGAALTALQGSAGSVIVQTVGLGRSDSRGRVISTTSDSPLNIVLSGVAQAAETYNAAVQILASGTTFNPADQVRYGVAWSPSGRSIAANGGAVGTDANAMHGGSTAQAWLGSSGGVSAWVSGWYQSFAIYNQRLPDATLKAKSVVGASYAANDNGMRFAFANDNVPMFWRLAL